MQKRELSEESGFDVAEIPLFQIGIYNGDKNVSHHPNGDVVYHAVINYFLPLDNADFYHMLNAKRDKDLEHETLKIKDFSIEEIRALILDNKVFLNNINILEDFIKNIELFDKIGEAFYGETQTKFERLILDFMMGK